MPTSRSSTARPLKAARWSGRGLVVAALLAMCGQAGAEAPQLRIASWNVEHLAAPGTGCRARAAPDYAALRNVLARLAADVWLFQEIESAEALALVLPGGPREWSIHIEHRSAGRSRGTCSMSAGSLTAQHTAVAVRRGLVVSRLDDVDLDGPGSLRNVVRVAVGSGPSQIEVASVHLKSGCAAGIFGQSCSKVDRQLRALTAWVSGRKSTTPLVIGGDFNRFLGPSDPLSTSMSAAGLVISDGESPDCWRRGRRIDHFALDGRAAAQLVEDQVAPRSGAIGLSDHCPISLQITPLAR